MADEMGQDRRGFRLVVGFLFRQNPLHLQHPEIHNSLNSHNSLEYTKGL